MWILEGIMALLIVFGFICFILGVALIFFGTIIMMLNEQVLFTFSRGLIENKEQSRFVGKILLIIMSFFVFIIEIPGIIVGYIFTIFKVLFHFAFNKKYDIKDCKKELFGFKRCIF